jgi:large subunit ribosomal protein L30e
VNRLVSLDRELSNLLKTGKYIIGSKRTLKALKRGEIKAVIIASTLKREIKEDIIYYCKISGVPLYTYPGSGWDLGVVCGKPFMVSTIGIIDQGQSNIISLIQEEVSKVS